MTKHLPVRAWLALIILAAAAGTAFAQDCAVDFETLDFGAALLGEARLRPLTVTNTGTGTLPLDVPAQPCPAVPAFAVLTSGHFDLAPGESRVIQIRFTPGETGAHSCELDLGTNDCPPVQLTGWGQAYSEPLGNHIGLYREPEAQICQAPLDGPNQVLQVRVLAVLPDFAGAGITACEFRIADLPVNGVPPAGSYTVTWSTSLVIGDLEDGIALAWPTPQPGPIVELGYIVFRSLEQTDWIGPDHTMSVEPTLFSNNLAIVDDNYTELTVGGGGFTFNCTDPPSCVCYEPGQPVCYLQPNSLNFGVVNVGGSAQQSFTIWNQGGGILAGFVSEDCPDFDILAGGGAYSLAGGESHTVYVRFAPETTGLQTCNIELGTVECPVLVCTGTGYAPVPICQLTPDHLDFGDLPVGYAQDLSFVIRNSGQGTLAGTVSEDCPDFSIIAGAGDYALTSNQTHTVTVRFEPGAPGAYECAIELGSEYCAAVPCTGTAHEPVYGCTLVPAELDFGDIALGSSAELEAELRNTGDLLLEGTISLDDPHFSLVEGGGAYSLAAGEIRGFTVRYTPLDYGPHAAAVETGNAVCGELPLLGQAHEPAPTCEISPASLEFGELLLGEYANDYFVIANDGDGPLVGEVTLDSEHFHLMSGDGAFTLLPGEVRQVSVRYFPAGYGPHGAVVELGAAVCADVPLSGFARNPAPGSDHIGLYLDEAGTLCAGDFPVGAPDTLFVIATVPSFADPGITGAEFRVDGLDALAGMIELYAEWTYPPTGGDVATGIRFDFGAPLPGEQVPLGRLTLAALGTLPDNSVLRVERSLDGDQLRVNDGDGLGWDVAGGRFTLNCTDPELCDCINFEGGVCALSTTELDFGTVSYGNSATRDFTITNVGYGPIAGDVEISGQYYSLTLGGGPFLLDQGEELLVRVRFQPGGVGTWEATVTTGLSDCPEVHCIGTATGGGGGNPFLGLYGDDNAVLCELDVPLYVNATVYVTALLPYWLPGITAAEFAIDNLLETGGGGIVTYDWNTPLVIGEPGYGIALAFNPYLPGPLAQLGEILLFPLNDSWIGQDHRMTIIPSQSSGNLVVVGTDYVEYWCEPGHITLNCIGGLPGGCDCYIVTPVVLTDFSLEDLHGAARLRWSYEGGSVAEFRLEGERDGLSWLVPWQETAPGQCLAEDHSAALASAGTVQYRLWGRQAGESWQPLRDEALTVVGLPLRTALLAAHPNPFNPNVTLPFTLGQAGRVRLAVYDVAGREVRLLLDAERAAGPQALVWDGRDETGHAVGSGVYFVRLEAAGLSESQKLVLLR